MIGDDSDDQLDHDHDERWQPDEGMIPAYLAGGGRPMRELSAPDRCWVVAGLTHAGKTAEDIRQRLDCSLRLIRTIRAEAATALALMYLQEAEAFSAELRLARQDHRSAVDEHASISKALSRVTAERDRLIDALQTRNEIDAFPKCGHPRDYGNTWTCARTGKRRCRTCHRDERRRARSASTVEV